MTLNKLGTALGVSASIIGGADAQNLSSQDKSNLTNTSYSLEAGTRPLAQQVAQDIVNTKTVTQEQVMGIQNELSSSKVNFDVRGAENFLQGSTSFIHNNVGASIQATTTDNLDQTIATVGLSFSADEKSALEKVVTGGAIKVSAVESTVKGALAEFDETGAGIEAVLHLNSALKKISVAHSKHSLDLGSAENFSVSNIENTETEIITTESQLEADDVSQTSLSMLVEITNDLAVILSYGEDDMGESFASAKANYQFNNNWSIQTGYQETARFSGDEKQDIYTATANYNKGNFSAFVGGRHNGEELSPYAGIRWTLPLDGKKLKPTRTSSAQYSLVNPVTGIGETHQKAIRQSSRTTSQTVSNPQASETETETPEEETETVVTAPAPVITALGTVSVNDNGGVFPTTINVSASNVRAGATYSLSNAPTGLSIDSSTGEMTFNQNIVGNQTFPGIIVTATNTDTTTDSDTFTLSVTDNG